MREEQTLDHPKSTSVPNLFMVMTTGFLFGTSLSIIEWITYQILQDVLLTIEFEPLTVLWLANFTTTIIHLALVITIFLTVRKKIKKRVLNWKKMLDQSKYAFSVSVLINIFFMVYWMTFLPDSFYISLDAYNFATSESLIYTILPIVFSVIDVLLILLLLNRLSNLMTSLDTNDTANSG